MDYKVGEVELSYRSKTSNKIKLETAEQAYKLMLNAYEDGLIEYRESFKVILLNASCKVLGYTTISEGGLTETPVDVRLIMQATLLSNATAIILAHNHPSGNLTPSRQDKELTKHIADCARMMNIRVIDHIIISSESYYSFTENGLI